MNGFTQYILPPIIMILSCIIGRVIEGGYKVTKVRDIFTDEIVNYSSGSSVFRPFSIMLFIVLFFSVPWLGMMSGLIFSIYRISFAIVVRLGSQTITTRQGETKIDTNAKAFYEVNKKHLSEVFFDPRTNMFYNRETRQVITDDRIKNFLRNHQSEVRIEASPSTVLEEQVAREKREHEERTREESEERRKREAEAVQKQARQERIRKEQVERDKRLKELANMFTKK